ncbi:MAG TPA: ABC transporter permease, partial [Cytophagaceae bacterium]|nr:ABC transporter permease [Cytophagaceae bacterium]
IKNINITFVDHDQSSYSQKLRSKILSSGYFRLSANVASYQEAFHLIENDETDVILEIPERFEEDLIRGGTQKLFIAVDAINGVKAGLGGAYLASIIGDFNNDIQLQWQQPGRSLSSPIIDVATSFWYNPLMIYFILMVPGILVNLLTSIGGMTSSLNIVKEKEMGTIEQINVTPIKKHHFILGKLIPFAVLGLAVFTIGLLIGRFVYGIIPLGNILLLYLFAIDYMFALLGFGLLISTYCTTQQQAISLIFFFIMIFNLMSGLFTPVDSMPDWARTIAHLIPTTYFIEVMRMIVIKGSGIPDVWYQFCVIFLIGIVLNSWAVTNYKKTS